MSERFRGGRPLCVRILLGAVLTLIMTFAAAALAERVPTLELIDSDPGQDAMLSTGQPVYLRFRYRSDIPIHILVSGSYRGDVVGGFLQDSEELFPAGNREAVVWLAYPFGARIDRVQVRIWNANKARVAQAAFPIRAEWMDANGTGAERQTKSWVTDLTDAQQRRMAATLSQAGETGGFDPFDLIFLCVPGYFLLQAALTFWTSGGWRKASLVPAVVMVPILAYTALAFAAQSNLWPLLLLLSAPLAFLYLIFLSVILLLRRLARTA